MGLLRCLCRFSAKVGSCCEECAHRLSLCLGPKTLAGHSCLLPGSAVPKGDRLIVCQDRAHKSAHALWHCHSFLMHRPTLECGLPMCCKAASLGWPPCLSKAKSFGPSTHAVAWPHCDLGCVHRARVERIGQSTLWMPGMQGRYLEGIMNWAREGAMCGCRQSCPDEAMHSRCRRAAVWAVLW